MWKCLDCGHLWIAAEYMSQAINDNIDSKPFFGIAELNLSDCVNFK